MLMLHENEAGAWDFARALEARGVPLDAMPLRADVDPIAFVQLGGYLARHRPEILHTHLVHADAYGQIAGLLAQQGTALSPGPHRIRTLDHLRDHAARHGLAIPAPGAADTPPDATVTTPDTPITHINLE